MWVFIRSALTRQVPSFFAELEKIIPEFKPHTPPIQVLWFVHNAYAHIISAMFNNYLAHLKFSLYNNYDTKEYFRKDFCKKLLLFSALKYYLEL